MATKNVSTLDFGSTPTNEASVVVADAGILAGSEIEAYVMRKSTSDNGVTEHEMLATFGRLVCGNIVAGVSYTIYCFLTEGLATGQFTVESIWD